MDADKPLTHWQTALQRIEQAKAQREALEQEQRAEFEAEFVLDLRELQLRQLPEPLFELTWLQKLDLGNEFSDHANNNQLGVNAVKALARLTALTGLYLSFNLIGDQVAKALALLTNLTGLGLRGNQIGNEGAMALVWLTKLSYLDLSGNQIGDDGAKALAKLPAINTLYLANNKIGYDVVKTGLCCDEWVMVWMKCQEAKRATLEASTLEGKEKEQEAQKTATKIWNEWIEANPKAYCDFNRVRFVLRPENSTTLNEIDYKVEQTSDFITVLCEGSCINFSGFTFPRDPNINQVIFEDFTRFENIRFSGMVGFYRCLFKEQVSFEGSTFPDYTYFTSVFRKRVSFNKARLLHDTDFVASVIHDCLSFEGAEFHKMNRYFDASFRPEQIIGITLVPRPLELQFADLREVDLLALPVYSTDFSVEIEEWREGMDIWKISYEHKDLPFVLAHFEANASWLKQQVKDLHDVGTIENPKIYNEFNFEVMSFEKDGFIHIFQDYREPEEERSPYAKKNSADGQGFKNCFKVPKTAYIAAWLKAFPENQSLTF